MGSFQIIMIILGSITIAGGIIGFYMKLIATIQKTEADTKVAIAKIQVEIIELRKSILSTEINALHSEKLNREDHIRIIERLDKILEIKVN